MYCASKWAVEGFLQGLRLETAGTALRVCSIQPGATETKLAAEIKDPDILNSPRFGSAGQLELGISHVTSPLKGMKLLAADDVARAVVYAAAQPSYVSINEGAFPSPAPVGPYSV